MRYSLLASLLACSCMSLQAQITETASEAVKNMGLGWNLGNTLDANSGLTGDFTKAEYWGKQGIDSENCWGQPNTSKELMKMMKEAGFGAIRVPITWYNHMDKDGNVDKEWMKRVHTIVDYVIDNDLYCIINVHHDTGSGSANGQKVPTSLHWIMATEDNYNANKERFEKLWTQIAEEFKDYGEKLVFAGYNEMLDDVLTTSKGGDGNYGIGSWCFASFNNYKDDVAASAYNAINSYAQSFVNAVRATGGNNTTRNLVVPTYAAANGSGNWNQHLQDPLKEMKLPADKSEGHTIFEVHAYPNISGGKIDNIKKDVDDIFTQLKTYLKSKGAPVIIGEWGTNNVDAGTGKTDYDVRRELMFEFCDYFINQAKENDMATFYWMGLTDGRSRSLPAFNQADLAECLAKSYHGSSFEGIYPEPEAASEATIFEGDKMLEWGTTIQIDRDYFMSIGENVQLELTYKLDYTDYDDIQFFYGDWDKVNKVKVQVEETSYEMDFNPSAHYGVSSGTEKTTIFTFDKDVYDFLASKGMIIQGHGVRVYKARITDPNKSGIEEILDQNTTDAIYNLSGYKVNEMDNGIYIKQGKIIFVK